MISKRMRHVRRLLAATVTVAVTGLMVPAAAVAGPDPADDHPIDFASSFEAGGPQPTWTNTVETDAAGVKKTAGVDGTTTTGIPGNVSDKVVEVAASGEYTAAGEVKENLVDGDVSTKWLVFASTGWVQFKLSEPVKVVHYAMSSANDAMERDPVDWTLSGSNDGTTFTAVDSRTGQEFPNRFQTKEYDAASTQAYTYYKLDITRNNGGGILQLAEVQLSNGDTTPPPPSDMKSLVARGPGSSPTAKANVGYTGLKAFQYSGRHTAQGRGYSYNKVYDVDVAVRPTTELSYMIFPAMARTDLRYPSTYAAVDLAFTDGTYLSELGAVDQHGAVVSPRGQAESKTLYVNQWNHKVSRIGAVAAGKQIKRILVAYDNPVGPAEFKGWFDDIHITGEPAVDKPSRPSDYVLTTRGTNSSGGFSRGNNFPATAVPHGFNFWSPMTSAGSMSWLYEYQRANNADNLPTVQAFTVSHEPSPWMGDRQTFQVMPSVAAAAPNANRAVRAMTFTHDHEVARPYYYGVTFDNGVRTEIAPTDHAAMFRFSFPGTDTNLIFDNVENKGGLTLDAANRTVTGFSDVRSGLSAGATRLFVYATFDKPVTASAPLTGGGGANVTGYMRFDAGADKTVTMRIATSLLSVDQARHNLELEVNADDTFDSVKRRAQNLWDDKLRVIEVEGASRDQLTTMYSNLYRLFLYPNSGYENTAAREHPVYRYASPFSPPVGDNTPTQTGAKVVDGKVHVNNGFWDTYRTTWAAYSLLTPTDAGEMVDGFVQQYRDGGWVSRWSSPGYANLMTGTSSDAAFTDAYLRGVRNFDILGAYDAAVRNATVVPPHAGVGRKGMDSSQFLGYTTTDTGEGLSWALEGFINDYGIANMSKSLYESSKPDDPRRREFKENYEYFLNRARNYVNMFDPATGFFQGRNADGTRRLSPDQYDPRVWGYDYTETNGWNFAFSVPQDGQGLANLYGGKDKLAQKLDTFFSTPETADPAFVGSYGGIIHEMIEARDVRMGMYGHSNQVSHHITYMYDYAGQPSKTQAKVREVLSRLFLGSEIGQGYAGDEDNGETSAWWLFSALGFYPLQMGSPTYAVGSPLFTKATVNLENGRKIVVNAPKNSARNVYVQGLKVNGQRSDKAYLTHDQLAKGAVLDFDMGPNPSQWGAGTASAPPSITTGPEVPRPLRDVTGPGQGTATGPVDVAGLFDNTSDTKVAFTGTPWVQYQPTTRDKVTYYTLTSGDVPGDAKSWVVKGSYDGTTWTTIDQRQGEAFRWRLQTKAFKIDRPARYAYYRIEVTGTTGEPTTTLSEVEFLATPPPACTTRVTGTRNGPLTVSSGVTCLDGATINGPVRVLSGASLYATGGKIAGPVDAAGASAVVLLGTAVGGPLNVTGATGEVAVETAKVDGPVNLVNNGAPVATIVAASTAGGPLHCAGNAQQPVNNGLPNKVGGPTSGQCQGL